MGEQGRAGEGRSRRERTDFSHCLSLPFHRLSDAFPLPPHCLLTAFSLPSHWLSLPFHCLPTAFSLPVLAEKGGKRTDSRRCEPAWSVSIVAMCAACGTGQGSGMIVVDLNYRAAFLLLLKGLS